MGDRKIIISYTVYMLHHVAVRFDASPTSSPELFSFLLDDSTLEVQEYIVSKEIAKISKKVHYHAQVNVLSYNLPKSVRKTIRELVKSMGLEGSELYVKKTKDLKKHLIYLTKDLDIVVDQWKNKEILEEAIKDTSRINAEKCMKMKHQLLSHIEQLEPGDTSSGILSIEQIAMEIIGYHVQRDYLPPSRTLLTQYTVYIITKLYEGKPFYNTMIMEVYKL